LTDTVNTAFDGAYLFAGINADVRPLSDYFDTPAPANRVAVASSFSGTFGFSQSDPVVASITGADMQTYLNTGFATLFDTAAWTTDWSTASSQNVRNRISTNELIETSTNANEKAITKLAMAYTMVADLGIENMNQDTVTVVADAAAKTIGEALTDLTELQVKLGTAQERVPNASERMSIQIDIITKQINTFEKVDPFEASTRVSSLLNQLETAYALTARIERLSLLNHL